MEKHHILDQIKIKRIIYPILIGLVVVVYMIYSDLNSDKLKIKFPSYPTNNEKQYSYQINKENNKITIQLTDSGLIHQDSLKFILSYWTTYNHKTSFFKDSVTFLKKENYFESNSPQVVKISSSGKNQILFQFKTPLKNVLTGLNFDFKAIIFLLLALSMMLIRDFGYTWRIRILTDKKLNWWQALRLILLWEFTSALTPSAIGGSAVAIFLLSKENLSVGKSTAVVMATIFLDEMYFLIFVPLVMLFTSVHDLFNIQSSLSLSNGIYNEFFYFALIGYLVILVFTLFLAYGLFLRPRGVKWLIIKVFRIKFLRKWLYSAAETGDEIIISSRELKKKNTSFWLKSSLGTIFSWTARYWIVNFLLLAFFSVSQHFLIFARQLVMWIMMLVSPTPGGSGFSEYVFATYLGQFIPEGLATALALIWRFITYYPYLFIGAILLPKWIKLKFGKPIKS